MSYRSKFIKLCKFAASGGLLTAISVQLMDGDKQNLLGSKFTIFAKSRDFSKVIDFPHGMWTDWDSNWDKREPASMVKPLKDMATAEDKAAYEEKIAANTPKADRIIVMVRHGQYNREGTQDSERYLTELGRKQADNTGERIALVYSHFLQKMDENGNKVTNNIKLVKSTMTRATETANIILKHLPDIEHTECDLIREGAPCLPDPPIGRWSMEPAAFFQEGARIEAGFRKYFHRSKPSQEATSVDILVCHGNVIRYFACRALQCDPRAWLRMAVHNGSITVFIIKPSGRVILLELGGAEHFHPDLLTLI